MLYTKLHTIITTYVLGVFLAASMLSVNAFAAKGYTETYALKMHKVSKSRTLKKLYSKLRTANSPERAYSIEKEIEGIWLDSGSPTVDVLMSRAIRTQNKKQYSSCLHLLNEIVTLAPDYPEGWYRRALVYFNKEQYAEALLDIRKVLTLDPKNFQAVHGLALILTEVGNKKAALKVYRKLLEIHPHYEEAHEAIKQLIIEVEGQDT